MTEFVHTGQEAVNGAIDGLLELYPEYRRVLIEREKYKGIILREQQDRVSVLVGAGSGNDPWCYGYVGKGLADGAGIGPVYTAPSARAIQAVTRALPNRKGVAYICANYAGDVLNFELASELAELDGIRTGTVAVADDIASAPRMERIDRRGAAGVLLAVKIAGGAAGLGMNLDEVLRITEKANERICTFSVDTAPIRDPLSGRVLIDIEPGMISYGTGFNGEQGLAVKPYVNLNDTVDTAIHYLITELQPLPSAEIVILVNGYARTSNAELLMIGRRVIYNMRLNEIRVHHILLERAFTLRDAGGFSISIMTLDEELRYCYEQPAWSPFIHGFSEMARFHDRVPKGRF